LAATSLALYPKDSTEQYVVNPADLRRTADGGRTWQLLPLLGEVQGVDRLIVHPEQSDRLYGIDSRFVFRSTDGGETADILVENFLEVEAEGDPDQEPSVYDLDFAALLFDPHDSETLYAGGAGGVIKSEDGGDSWYAANLGLDGYSRINSLAVDPIDPGILYAGNSYHDYDPTPAGLFRSADGGESWSAIGQIAGVPIEGDVERLSVDHFHPSLLYAAIELPDSALARILHRSWDRGHNWELAGKPAAPRGIAVDSRNPRTLYAEGFGGLHVSIDAGNQWYALDAGFSLIESLSVARDSGLVYGAGPNGVYRLANALTVTTGDIDSDGRDEFALASLQTHGSIPQIEYFDDDGELLRRVTHDKGAVRLDLTAGDFDGDGAAEWALAMIGLDAELEVALYDADGTLLGRGGGGTCSWVSIVSSQLDQDPQDEYVVGLIQGDGQAAAIGFNPDGSRLGKLLTGQGFEVEVGVGDFDGDPRLPEVVFAYRALDSTLRTEVLDVFGNRLGTAGAGECRETRLAVGNLSGDQNAEYAVSLSQSDATTAEIAFAADGTRLWKGEAGPGWGPRLATGYFLATAPNDGILTAMIQSDGTPVAILFGAGGQRLGKGVAPEPALVSDVAAGDVDGDGFDEAILVYLNSEGTTRWAIFHETGEVRLPD
jgi:hypothetical protein